MDLRDRYHECSELLKEYLPFFSQWDLDVIKGSQFEHKWLDIVQALPLEKLLEFDALRSHKVLSCPDWNKTVMAIEEVSRFDVFTPSHANSIAPGNKKKQHELKCLSSLLSQDKDIEAFDFGGGVGHLSFYLAQELNLCMTVLEKDEDLIRAGLEKKNNTFENVIFQKHEVGKDKLITSDDKDYRLAIGLHTCGHFANDMFRDCIRAKIPKIVNFGCCYSKIKNDDYHLCSFSDRELYLNQRALSCATLGFGIIPVEFYHYRKKIMDYKFSFYHWMYKQFGQLEFCSMSNARRSLYKENFPGFVEKNLQKFFPDMLTDSRSIDLTALNSFYEGPDNRKLNHYLSCYYALSRYFGKLIETYILCDRALFLKENDFEVEILEVFDPMISPRNKAIVARLH